MIELRNSGTSWCNAFWARGTFTYLNAYTNMYAVFSVDRYDSYTGAVTSYSGRVSEDQSGFTLMFGRQAGSATAPA